MRFSQKTKSDMVLEPNPKFKPQLLETLTTTQNPHRQTPIRDFFFQQHFYQRQPCRHRLVLVCVVHSRSFVMFTVVALICNRHSYLQLFARRCSFATNLSLPFVRLQSPQPHTIFVCVWWVSINNFGCYFSMCSFVGISSLTMDIFGHFIQVFQQLSMMGFIKAQASYDLKRRKSRG